MPHAGADAGEALVPGAALVADPGTSLGTCAANVGGELVAAGGKAEDFALVRACVFVLLLVLVLVMVLVPV